MKKDLIKKVCSREVMTYLIAGVLTTVVNFIASYLFYNILKINENVTTVLAWIVAVLFAYIINNSWVFLQKYEGLRLEIIKIGKFFGARLLTLIIELGGIMVFVTWLKMPYWYIKAILAVVVTILNYVFSKIFIFIKKDKRK